MRSSPGSSEEQAVADAVAAAGEEEAGKAAKVVEVARAVKEARVAKAAKVKRSQAKVKAVAPQLEVSVHFNPIKSIQKRDVSLIFPLLFHFLRQ